MIKPGKNKVIVELYNLTNPYIYLPETYKKPSLSVAEIIDGNDYFNSGQMVLVPTLAGIGIKSNGFTHRLMNKSDILACLTEEAIETGSVT